MDKHKHIVRIDLAPLGGIAGDMFAAAMFNGFPHLYDYFCDDLNLLGIEGLSATIEDRLSNGLQAKYFNVQQQTTLNPPRTLAAVKEFFYNKPLDESVANHAVGIFTKLAQAESEVHGKSIETIHFHEVSDWDSVIDILAAAGVIARLKCSVWRVGVLPLGAGTVNTAHGDIPVPAPATLALLKDFQWQDDGISGERVTPTGAAILCYLQATDAGAGTTAASLVTVGSGCGSRDLNGRANILRMTAFSTRAVDTASRSPLLLEDNGLLEDKVTVVAFEVDDMTAEEIAWAADEIRAVDGVLDVSCQSMQGKKNRVSIGFRITTSPEHLHAVVDQSFLLTSTIGIRYSHLARFVLRRSEDTVESTNVKVVERPAGIISAKASSDDLASAVSLDERRRLAQVVCNKALQSNNHCHNNDEDKQ